MLSRSPATSPHEDGDVVHAFTQKTTPGNLANEAAEGVSRGCTRTTAVKSPDYEPPPLGSLLATLLNVVLALVPIA